MLKWSRLQLFPPTMLILRCKRLLDYLGAAHYCHNITKGSNVVDEHGEKCRNTRENKECNFQLYKSKGQHLLRSTRVLDTIVKISNIEATDTVLEIGPGTGNLTLRLLEAAREVVAVEIDKRMAEVLEKRVAESGLEDRLTLIREDALKTEFPQFDLVVANIPYCISSPLIAKLLYGTRSCRSATLLLQKEFARRLLANPGDSEFNRLAVNVKLVADVEYIMDVSKRDFFPVPKVDSSVVVIRPKVGVPDVDLNEWCAFTRTLFCKKNKTLGATLKQKKKLAELMKISEMMGLSDKTSVPQHGSEAIDEYDDVEVEEGSCYGFNVGDCEPPALGMGLALFKENVVEILKSSGFEDKRPSKLSVEELLHLLSLFNQKMIFFHDKRNGACNAEVDTSFEL